MVCPKCGAPNSEQAKSCSQCGRGLTAGADDQTVYLDETPAPVARPSAAGAVAMTWGSLPSRTVAMPSSIPQGTMFGRYRIESLLGEGGMGAVYRAFDTELERTVALKLVRPELAVNEQTMKRFKQELLLASRISHKNILRIHDLGDSGGIKFITMAFVAGTDLAGVIDRDGPLPIERALRFARQLCAALEAAHEEGVVHRDLKPQNVLVDASDNLYVSDFGLAKSLEAEVSMGTRTGQILGTPRYMSPEQVEARDVDRRSDLYAAGLLLYEMLTAELPFRGESAMQLMYQRVSELPRDPRRARPGLPDYLAAIVLKCLEKDPAKRYQSAREILSDLDAQNAPVVSNEGGKTIAIQLRRPTRRGVVAAMAAVLAIAGALAAIPRTRNAIRSIVFGAEPAAEQKLYVAVVPSVVSGERYLADGIGDSLIAKLSGLRNVYVADANALATAPAAAKEDDARLAELLGVKVVFRVAVTAAGDRISVTLKGQDTQHQRALLTREVSGVRQDLLAVQDELFEAVAGALLIRQTDEERARTTAKPTQDIAAYDLYLRGASLIKARRDRQTAEEALKLFQQATKADTSFALAYAGIADASVLLGRETRDESWNRQAVSAAEQAERLNGNQPQVQIALGTAYNSIGKRAEGAAKLQRAVELAPNSDEGYRRLGRAYLDLGRADDAIRMLLKARDINPYYWNNHNGLAQAYLRHGDHRNAIASFREVVRLKRDEVRGWTNLGAAYFAVDDWEQAAPALEKAATLDPKGYHNLGVAYFYLRRYAEAAKAFEAALANNPDDANAALALAETYRWSGQSDKATAAYARARSSALKQQKSSPAEALSVLAACAAHQKQHAQALAYVRQARTIDKEDADLLYREAIVHAAAERWPEAMSSLRAALANGYSARAARTDPEFESLSKRADFQAVFHDIPKRSYP